MYGGVSEYVDPSRTTSIDEIDDKMLNKIEKEKKNSKILAGDFFIKYRNTLGNPKFSFNLCLIIILITNICTLLSTLYQFFVFF